MPNVFSVPIFFIVFRETLEAAIIISVLLGIVEQIANTRLGGDSLPETESEKEKQNTEAPPSLPSSNNDDASSSDDGERKKLLRKLRIQVYYSSLFRILPPRRHQSCLPRFLSFRFLSVLAWVY